MPSSTQRRNIVESLSTAQRAFLSLPECVGMNETDQNTTTSSAPRAAPATLPRRTRSREQAAAVSSNRPEPLRSVTLRLRASTAEALRRVSMQRSLEYVEPFTQQAIVEAALTTWLQRNGANSNGMQTDFGPQGS